MTNDNTDFRPCGEVDAIDESPFCRNTPYAMAYVRMQRWERPMTAGETLRRGTAFRSLVKPFWAMEVER